MLGIPFYGYDSLEAIVGNQFIERLKQYKVDIEYNTKAKEHVVK